MIAKIEPLDYCLHVTSARALDQRQRFHLVIEILLGSELLDVIDLEPETGGNRGPIAETPRYCRVSTGMAGDGTREEDTLRDGSVSTRPQGSAVRYLCELENSVVTAKVTMSSTDCRHP